MAKKPKLKLILTIFMLLFLAGGIYLGFRTFESRSQPIKNNFFKESVNKCKETIDKCNKALSATDFHQLFIILDEFSQKNNSAHVITVNQKKEILYPPQNTQIEPITFDEPEDAYELNEDNAEKTEWQYKPDSTIAFKRQLEEASHFDQSNRFTLYFIFDSEPVDTKINKSRLEHIFWGAISLASAILLILFFFYFISKKYNRALNIITSEKDLDPFAGESLKTSSILARNKNFKKVKQNLSDEELNVMKLIKKKGISVSEILKKSNLDELDTFEILTKLGKKHAIQTKKNKE